MSNQSSQRLRRNASPSFKQGPMRATFHFGLRQGSSPTAISRSASGRKISPSSSPTPPAWGPAVTDPHKRTPRSPDHRASPDRASPISPFITKPEKSRTRHSNSPSSLIKRTNSLDTYLKGEWPRETVVPYHSPSMGNVPPTAERSTQTPDWGEEFEEPVDRKKKSHMRSSSLGTNDPLIKKEIIKARLAKSKEGRVTNSGLQRSSPVQASHSAIATVTIATATVVGPSPHHSKAVTIPHIITKPTIHIRGSVEGLSQEIETLVLRNSSGNHTDNLYRTQDPTPDGHRAPIAELLTTRTIDTQTPKGPGLEDSTKGPMLEELFPSLGIHVEQEEELQEQDEPSSSRGSSGHSSSSSPASRSQSESPPTHPIIPGTMDSSRPSSGLDANYSMPQKYEKDCASPNLKSFSFAREPPDGCEKVKMLHEENGSALSGSKQEAVCSIKESLFSPIKKPTGKCCIPSEVSAFCPLLKPYVLQPSERALKSLPGGTTSFACQTIDGQ